MAIQQLQLPSYQVNNTVDQAQWNTLGNLGNVYREAEAARNKQAALASLGTDPAANMRTLLTSNDPALAQLGLNLQQKTIERAREDQRYGVTDARANAQLAIQQAAAKRAQEDWEQAETDRQNAAKLMGGLFGGTTPPPAPPQTASPFPAPGPSPQATVPPIPQTQTPSYIPQPAMPPPQTAAPAPNAFEATPRPPAELQPPPVKAEGGDTNLPEWAQSAAASPPDTSIVGRVASNLTSPNPAAAAGLNREQLGALYANPLTRPLATAFLQKQLDPGTWTYTKLDDGRLVGHNSRTNEIKDVTPPTASGAPPATKDQRERDARYADAIARGYDKDTANYVAINGKLPKEDLTPTEMKAVSEAEKQATSGRDVLDNLARLRELSPQSWSGWGASKRAAFVNALLPNELIPQGAVNTEEMSNLALQNVAGQAKAMFGARLAVAEVKLLNQIETTPNMSDAARQQIYTRIERMIQRHVDAADREAEGIRNKTYYKPGGGAPAAGAAPAGAAADPLGLR